MRTTAPGDQLLTGACLVVSSWPAALPGASRRLRSGSGQAVGLHHRQRSGRDDACSQCWATERPARTAAGPAAPSGAPKAPRKPFWWIGIAAVLAGLAIAADVGWFFYHSQQTGDSLLSAENAAIAAAGRISRFDPVVPTAVCPPFINGGSQAQGVVSASEIGMAAPVLAGDGDSQINVAVGHADGSSWPGQPGTTLFAAHDVTYFSHINQLAVHSEIDFVTPCQTFTYQVTGHQVVQKGSPVYSPSTESSWCSRPATRPMRSSSRTSAISSRPSSSRCASTTRRCPRSPAHPSPTCPSPPR